MQRYPDYTRERLKQLADRMRLLIYPEIRSIDDLQVSQRVDRISYAEAQKLAKFRPARLGEQFGPLWATFWFRAKCAVPKHWKGRRVDLLWASHSEATLWMNGRSIQGLNHEPMSFDGSTRPDATLLQKARGGESLSFQIEMACNKLFGYDGDAAPYFNTISPYVLDRADIALFDEEAWQLYHDFWILQQLEADADKGLDSAWAGKLLSELNLFANSYDPADRSTWKPARKILDALYKCHNASSVHELSAIGHAHIDTAWLWPLAETERKCERTFSSQTAYMDAYPEYKFACSQAQQYAWIKRRNPDLYERIKRKVKAGQWVPVGGTWIEPDCNIPSGEALIRQFLFGQRFFKKEFGITCREFWNPDVFGYNGQLPQICRLAGITRFLTQKLSWNRFNKPQHHTFIWEGIDGSEVFTHFPPADTYNANCAVPQLRLNARAYKDHDRSRHSLLVFGYGDGGGGPTRTMLETLRRARDLEGLPRTQIRSSAEFFDLLERDCTDRARMVGELYFEYHRGTYTSQAATKRGNRKSEILLHDIEFLATAAGTRGHEYPTDELDRLWKVVLTNQFHDILPGSSIQLVYDDAKRDYAMIERDGKALRADAVTSLLGKSSETIAINTTSFERAEVGNDPNGKPVWVEVPSYGIAKVSPSSMGIPARGTTLTITKSRRASHYNLENRHLRATLSPGGDLLSLIEKSTNRESLTAPGNQLLLYADTPTAWQAWDVDPFHLEQETPCPPATGEPKILSRDPLRVEIAFERAIGLKSRMRQTIRLDAESRRLEFHCETDWNEENKFLKVAFPVNARSMNATYEMQFGNTERPTHFNTSHDLARYEVPGHRWSDLSEHGFGVALLTESKYGFSTFGNTMRISLLRSPKHPDPQADMGKHTFAYAIMPHAGTWREAGVVAEAAKFNVPLIIAKGSAETTSFASTNDANLVIDTIKKAEDSNALIIRLYECHGARGTANLRCALPFKSATFCNALEEDMSRAKSQNDEIQITYEPYKIITVKLVGAPAYRKNR